jgi:hypothetical protein
MAQIAGFTVSQKRTFLIPHFALLLNFSAPVAITIGCAKVLLTVRGAFNRDIREMPLILFCSHSGNIRFS